MAGQVVAYVRVSSVDQNPDRQLEALSGADRTFEDRVSGKSTERPQLEEMLKYVRDGDVVRVASMDRLARNLDDLRRLVREMTGRGVRVEFVKEGLSFTGEDTPMATLLLSVMGAFAEFERSLIRERQAEGIAVAKAKGVYKGRAPVVTSAIAQQALARIAGGVPKAAVARELGVSRQTLYSAIAKAQGATLKSAPPSDGPA